MAHAKSQVRYCRLRRRCDRLPLYGGAIDAENNSIEELCAAGVGISDDTNLGPEVVTGNTFNSIAQSAVAVSSALPPTIENNVAVDVGSSANQYPAYEILNQVGNGTSVDNIDPDLVGGNTASGGYPVFLIGGSVSTGTLPADDPTWLVTYGYNPNTGSSYYDLNVPAGVTLTIAQGVVLKASFQVGITVSGTLDAVGAPGLNITFTSINDNASGRQTGSSDAAAGDWAGISVESSGTLDIEQSFVWFASVGIDSTSGQSVTVEHNTFSNNSTAVDISAAPGTNGAIHDNWFDGNGMAIESSSDWDGADVGLPFLGCQFVPSIAGGTNSYGPSRSPEPYITDSSEAEGLASLLIPGTEQSPDGWFDEVYPGTSDTVNLYVLPCQPIDGLPYAVIASAVDFGAS